MPSLVDLDTAMLHAGRSVPAVKRLGGGSIVLSGSGQPWRVVGQTAVVYQLNQPSGGALALRCPLGDAAMLDPTLGQRYRSLAADPAVAPLRRSGGPLVSGIVYVGDGVSLPAGDFRSVSHPVMAMEWVKGPTLLAAVDRACREGDTAGLTALPDAWAAAVTRLTHAGFTHGDLVADNVMIRPGGGIALVDYDTCSWADGAGSWSPGSGRQVDREAILPPGYAHPSGAVPPISQRDDYPALVTYAALQVLGRWPQLRQHAGDPPSKPGGALLFSAADLRDPERSALIGAIRGLDDPVIARLLTILHRAGAGPVAEVPPLHEVVAEVRMVTSRAGLDRSRSRATWQPERLSSRTDTWPSLPRGPEWDAPEQLPRSERPATPEPDWDAFRPETARTRAPSVDPLVRQRKLTQLNSLLLAGDEVAAERFWYESGLEADREAVRELGSRIADIGRRRMLGQARSALEAGDADALLRSWNDGGLDHYQPAAPLRPLVESARRRNGGVERLQAALEVKDLSAVMQLWPEVRGDARAATYAIQVHALVAAQAGAAIAAALRRGDDEALSAAVSEAEASGIAVDQSARRAARTARERIETRRALRAAIAVNDRATLSMLALSGRLSELGPIEPATTRAVRRALAWPHLEQALFTDDDAAIRATYDADLFADPGALTPEQRARIELALARLGWLAQVRTALRKRDAGSLRSALGKPPPGAEARLTRVERSRIARLTAEASQS